MRLFFILCSLSFSTFLHAQKLSTSDTTKEIELELHVGDTMEIGICEGANFKHLDYFRKTRWADTIIPYDTATGEGFYKSFFTTGDFDASELPASFSGAYYEIMGMEVLINKNTGKEMGILYLKATEPNSVIWVDFTEAMQAKEIGLIGQFKK
ncbi:MAG: hypothetical protein KG003_08435 [Bacteroidetes bacterium]|nr:hypothetical protein [Bacteroidota bacterium]